MPFLYVTFGHRNTLALHTRKNFVRKLNSLSLSTYIDWLVGMLLLSRSGLVEEDALEVFHYYVFTCPLLS